MRFQYLLRVIPFFGFLIPFLSLAQDGVLIDYSGGTRDNSAVLDVRSTDQGVLVPRVNIVDLNTAAPVSSPADGLLVYNTNVSSGQGFHLWNGSSWVKIMTSDDTPTGSGVATELAFWNTSNELSSDVNLYWDDPNNRLGVGTDTPEEQLHVAGTGYFHNSVGGIKIDGTLNENANDYVRSSILSSRDGDLEWNAGTDQWELGSGSSSNDFVGILHSHEGELGFITGGNNDFTALDNNSFRDSYQRMTIDHTGKVGIGTRTPQETLHVDGDVRITGLDDNADRIVMADANGDLYTSASLVGTTLGDNLGDHMATENIQLGNFWLSNDGDDEGIIIDNEGDVGIGVSPTDFKLTVDGGIEIMGDGGGTDVGGIIYNPIEGGSPANRWAFRFDLTDNASYPYLTNRTPNGAVAIKTGTASGGGENEHFRIEGGDGTVNAYFTDTEVGIGLTDPDYALQVEGDVVPGQDVTFDLGKPSLRWNNIYVDNVIDAGLTEGSVVFVGSSNELAEDNSNFFWDDANDRLGIGETEPSMDLEVVGNVVQADGNNHIIAALEPRVPVPSISKASEVSYSGSNANYPNLEGGSTPCSGAISWDAARDHAEAQGGRLPTVDELLSDVTSGSGCGYDANYVWTQTKCGYDAYFVGPGRSSNLGSFPVECRSASSSANTRFVAEVDKGFLPAIVDGDGAIRADEVLARVGDGISIGDDAGNLGVFVEDGGQVGIGTNNPSATLDIEEDGTNRAIEFDGGDAMITIHDGSGNFNIKAGVDENSNIATDAGGSHIRMDDHGYIALTVDENTSVGGSFSTSAELEVEDDHVDIERGDFTIDDVKPIRIERYYLGGGDSDINYNTGESTANWTAVIAGFSQGFYDMDENGNEEQDEIYMYESGGTWRISARANSHSSDHADWTVHVMFMRNEMVTDNR